MPMKRIALILGFLNLFLLGCASQPTYWMKQGASPHDFYMDKAQCNAQAFSISNALPMQIAIVQNQCLRGKGWYLAEQPTNLELNTQPLLLKERFGAAVGESCQVEKDCQGGLSCRSKKGGGAECRR